MTNPYPPPYGQQSPPPRKKNNTALWITLGIVGGLILLCGGCGLVLAGNGDDDSRTQATTTRAAPLTTAPPRATTSAGSVADLAYVAALDKNQVPYSSKPSAIELGHTVCEARQAGNTSVAVALKIAEKGYSPQQAGVIVGAAQAAYCPKFN